MENNEFYKGDNFDVIPIQGMLDNCLPNFVNRYNNNVTIPNFCAFENARANFIFIGCTEVRADTNNLFHIGVTFECSSCKKYITVEHTFTATNRYKLEPLLYGYSFINVKLPFSEEEINEIDKFSKDFLKIYTQSQAAENMHLDEIVVGGYRRALETLVKDYLFNYKGFDKAGDTALKNCIKDHMSEFSVKTINVAKLAVDIGNDGTHWKSELNFNVEYMKKLITMFCNDILNSIAEDEASAILEKQEQDKKK